MDQGTGLTYAQQRYFDPMIGRFLSRDPADAGFNNYWYANNNPYKFTDPDGRVAQGGGSNKGPQNPNANGDYSMSATNSSSVDFGRMQFVKDALHPLDTAFIQKMNMIVDRMKQRIPGVVAKIDAGLKKGFSFYILKSNAEDIRTVGHWSGKPDHRTRSYYLFADPDWTVSYTGADGKAYTNPAYLNLYHEVGHFLEFVGRNGRKLNPHMLASEEPRVMESERKEANLIGAPGRRSHYDPSAKEVPVKEESE